MAKVKRPRKTKKTAAPVEADPIPVGTAAYVSWPPGQPKLGIIVGWVGADGGRCPRVRVARTNAAGVYTGELGAPRVFEMREIAGLATCRPLTSTDVVTPTPRPVVVAVATPENKPRVLPGALIDVRIGRSKAWERVVVTAIENGVVFFSCDDGTDGDVILANEGRSWKPLSVDDLVDSMTTAVVDESIPKRRRGRPPKAAGEKVARKVEASRQSLEHEGNAAVINAERAFVERATDASAPNGKVIHMNMARTEPVAVAFDEEPPW